MARDAMRTGLGLLGAVLLAGCAGEASSSSDGTEPLGCAATAAEGLEVAATDGAGQSGYSLGYAPHAVTGCLLVYVHPDGSLRARDLARGGKEETVAAAAEAPRRPTAFGGVVAWEAVEAGRRVVRVRAEGATRTVTGAFDHAAEPRAAGDAVAFTGWLSADEAGDTDVFLYEPGQPSAVVVASGPGQQRFPDVSAAHVAFADFAEDVDGRFDEDATDAADVVVMERATGRTTRRARPGKQAFPLLGAEGRVVYLEWGPLHPEPKFSAYTLLVGGVSDAGEADVAVVDIETASPYVRPTARGAWIEWVQWRSGMPAALYRQPADLGAGATVVTGMEGNELHAPVAGEGMTLVAARAADGAMVIRAAER
ncbi:hypothetical protein [Polyangium sp. 6x1]|uniref:hypothetical protein n=1 Tax=Polyangium sp. 6x1 TaxID=3042689 RepID=UPI00248312C2|nr:hypothetical protein [Polyangium sp. 6x1]MDI1446859.1 hypothetical protein [Polyangium sp. 6x1]